MRNLRKVAMTETLKTVNNSSNYENINEALMRILFKDKKSLTREELRAEIAVDRLINKHSEEVLQEMTDKDYLEILNKALKTVKNGLDTSISNSQNNSSFSYNEKYAKVELVKDARTNKYTIVEKAKA